MLKKLHQQWADEYLKTGNATGAYQTVYNITNKGTAMAASSRLLKRTDISDYIKEQQAIMTQRGIWSLEEILIKTREIVEDKTSSKTIQLHALRLGAHILGVGSKKEIKHSGQIDTTLSHLSDEELDDLLDKEDDIV